MYQHQHPDRAPSGVWDAAVRVAAATVLMTVAAVLVAVLFAAALLLFRNPLELAIAAIVAISVGGFVAGTLSRWIHP